MQLTKHDAMQISIRTLLFKKKRPVVAVASDPLRAAEVDVDGIDNVLDQLARAKQLRSIIGTKLRHKRPVLDTGRKDAPPPVLVGVAAEQMNKKQ
jgi:hypothetical protein